MRTKKHRNSQRRTLDVNINEVIAILAKYGLDNIRALTAVSEVIDRMGYEVVDGEIVEHTKY
jgi:urease gamma subunit